MMDREKTLLRLAIVASLLFASIVAIHIPIQVAAHNADAFAHRPWQYLLAGVPVAAVMAALLSALSAALRGRGRLACAALLVLAAMASWLYGLVFVGTFGLLDARNALRFDSGIGGWEYPLLLIACAATGELVRRHHRAVTWFLAVLLLALTAQTGVQIASAPTDAAPASNHPALYRLSKHGNVFVILLDSFQADVFADSLDPATVADLDGFTFYRNTAAGASTTYVSLPEIHSGRLYDPDTSLDGFFRDAVAHDSFLTSFANAGYEAALVNPIKKLCPDKVSHCGGVAPSPLLASVAQEWISLLDISLMRAVPFPAKAWVYNDNKWRVGRLVTPGGDGTPDVDGGHIFDAATINASNKQLDTLAASFRVEDGPKTVKFVHSFATHVPLVLDAECKPADHGGMSRAAAIGQGTCALRHLRSFLATLKRLGVYDTSTIAVLSDHGVSLRSTFLRSDLSAEATPDYAAAFNGDNQLFNYAANALFLLKPPGAKGPLGNSDTPVELRQLGATLCDAAAACQITVAPSALQPRAAAEVDRDFLAYRWVAGTWTKDRIPDAQMFHIGAGPVWRTESWRPAAPLAVRLGTDIAFGVPDPSKATSLALGWGSPDKAGTWIQDHLGSLFIQLDREPPGDVLLHAKAYGLTGPGKFRRQEADVLVNGVWVDRWAFKHGDGDREFDAVVPKAALERARPIRIDIRPAFPVSPATLGMSKDTRPLGINVRSIKLSEAGPDGQGYALGQTISFATGAYARQFRARGWAAPEPWGSWIAGHQGLLTLALPPEAEDQPLMLEAKVRGYTDANHPEQPLEVAINGQTAGRWMFRLGEPERLIRVPFAPSAPGIPLVVEFRAPNPAMLGIGVGEMRILKQ